MSRLTLILPMTAVLCYAQTTPPPDTANMSSDVHAPLFQGPKPIDAGATTARLAGSLPEAGKSAPARSFLQGSRASELSILPHG